MIQIQNLTKSYGRKAVLQSISTCFEDGKVYGIVGQNGAGKTTLFRCLAGLEPYTGEIIASQSPLKCCLGLLTVEPYYMAKMTGEEYIYLLTDARGIRLKDLEEKNIFQLPLKDYVSNYSTGMKKKLALTAVLLQDNRYYIFDEPYNGIDLESSMLLTAIIQELKARGKTVILSSHIFSTLKDCCDEILLLDQGRIQKTVQRENFDALEDEMKDRVLMLDIEKLIGK